jgi:hypothetical protein
MPIRIQQLGGVWSEGKGRVVRTRRGRKGTEFLKKRGLVLIIFLTIDWRRTK